MKLIQILFCFSIFFGFSQEPTERSGKTVKYGVITSSDGAYSVFENNEDGKQLFKKYVDDTRTIITAFDYDSLGREVMSYSVYSDLGFSLFEKKYSEDVIRYYTFETFTKIKNSFNKEALELINSKADFLEMPITNYLKAGKRYVSKVEVLDTNRNVVKEVNFSKNGDTTSVHKTYYNESGKKSAFHFNTLDAKNDWRFKLYYVYDDSANLVQMLRVTELNNRVDTTEVRNYRQDKSAQLISKDYYKGKTFVNRTTLEYLENGDRIEYYYEADEYQPKVKTIFMYNQFGFLIQTTSWDYRKRNDEQITTTNYELKYW